MRGWRLLRLANSYHFRAVCIANSRKDFGTRTVWAHWAGILNGHMRRATAQINQGA